METANAIDELNTALASRYVIDREIGHGGMATVYLARDLRHDRRVALKLLLAELGAILGPERFLSEIRVTANLQHPNLLPLFDSGEAQGRLFYVMPFVEGESLRHRLDREKQLPLNESLRITAACASALDYAHRNHVIHRDLKPENILLSAGQPVIADFGIALAVSNAGGARITQSGLSLGTPQYMSPEQAAADREVDGRSDIYSLGCVLYEMLTGDPPHTGSTVQAVIAKVLVEKPRSVRSQRDRVPEHVDATIERALAKLPADRWATAAEFAEALVNPALTSDSRISATPSGGQQQFRHARSRSRIRGNLWPVTALVAVIAAAAGWWRVASTPAPVPMTFTIPTPPSARLALDPSTVLFSPDGKSIVYAASVGGERRLYSRRLDDLVAREIRGTENARLPFFSPDGKWIAYAIFGGTVQKVPVSGGTPIAIAKTAEMRGGTWSTSGDIVVGSDSGLYRINPQGGPPVLFTKPAVDRGEIAHTYPMFLPDGKTIVFRIEDRVTRRNDRIGVASLGKSGYQLTGITGGNPLAFFGGNLFFGRVGGAIAAVPFDVRRRKAAAEPAAVVEDVSVFTGAAASFAANGSLVYVKSRNASQLVIADEKGALTSRVTEERRYFSPRLSPNGRVIAVAIAPSAGATRADIWTYDTQSQVLSRVTSQATSELPEWTHDGKYIVYRRTEGKSEFWRVAADGSGSEERFFSAETALREVSLSPDGRLAVFSIDNSAGNRDLWLLSLDAAGRPGKATPLLASAFNELNPRVSPDGRWLAYSSDESGRYEVYVRPLPRGARVQVSTNSGTEPVWTSNEIVYRSGTTFVAASLDTTNGISVTTRRELFKDNYLSRFGYVQYDVDRSGRRFVLLEPVGSPEMVVIVNGAERLLTRGAASNPP